MGDRIKPQDDRTATAIIPPRPERFDVVVVGDEFSDWLPVLVQNSELWGGMPEFRAVALEHDGWPGDGDAVSQLVLPLLEHNIRALPGGWALVPPRPALDVFADKARFAAFVADQGLDALAPQTYGASEVRFPCVLKRTDLWASHGIRLVMSADELGDCLGREPWAGQAVVIQEYIPADWQLTLHAVAVDGLFVWHAAYEVEVPADAPIRKPRPGEVMRRVRLSARDVFALQQFIAPLAFSGPLNVDFRRRADGTIAVLEINPRLGGSLFRPFATDDLRAALGAIARHARWHERSELRRQRAA